MRRKSREVALQILFQTEFAPSISMADFLSVFEDNEPYTKEVLTYSESLITGVKQNKAEIDSLISKASQHWKLDRMSAVDRNLLRIAIFEMKKMNPPLNPGIAINEALELAKLFSGTDSSGFINGILDQVAKSGDH
jgi:N utilization substance protein B